eukprot:807304_1
MPAKKSRAGVLIFLAVCVFNYLTDASQLESDVKYALPSPLESNVEFQAEEKREELNYADFSTALESNVEFQAEEKREELNYADFSTALESNVEFQAEEKREELNYADFSTALESNVEFQSEEKREELDYADFSTANQFPIYPFPDGISATPPTLPFNVRPNVNFRSMNDREMKRFRTAWPQSMHDSSVRPAVCEYLSTLLNERIFLKLPLAADS